MFAPAEGQGEDEAEGRALDGPWSTANYEPCHIRHGGAPLGTVSSVMNQTNAVKLVHDYVIM